MTGGERGQFVDVPCFGPLEVHPFGKVGTPLKCSFGPMARRAAGLGSIGRVARGIVASIELSKQCGECTMAMTLPGPTRQALRKSIAELDKKVEPKSAR